QFFGPGSFVAGSVLGVFELGERFASQRAKDDLSKWLLTFDVQKAKALPDGTQELFERIFGERHFSLKCFVRSAAFSLGAITFITILRLLIAPEDVLSEASDSNLAVVIFIALWLTWSIIIGYFSLFKTRVILGLTIRTQLRSVGVIAILVMDFIFYLIIFFVGSTLVSIFLEFIEAPSLVLDALSSYDAIIVLITMIEPTFY